VSALMIVEVRAVPTDRELFQRWRVSRRKFWKASAEIRTLGEQGRKCAPPTHASRVSVHPAALPQ